MTLHLASLTSSFEELLADVTVKREALRVSVQERPKKQETTPMQPVRLQPTPPAKQETEPMARLVRVPSSRLFRFATGIPALIMVADVVHQSQREYGIPPQRVSLSELNYLDYCVWTIVPKKGTHAEYFAWVESGFVYSVEVSCDPALSNLSANCMWEKGYQFHG